MIKYDVNKNPYERMGDFSVRERNGKLVAYIRVMNRKTGEVVVMPRAKFLLEGLPVDKEEHDEVAPVSVKEDDLEVDEKNEELVSVVDTPAKTETAPLEVVEYIATHTRTKEEISIEGEEGLKSFVNKHQLDPEAVEAMLEGKQNTHKKWRVVKK